MFRNEVRKYTISGLFGKWIQLFFVITILGTVTISAGTFTVNSTGDLPDANIADGVCDAGGGVCTLRAAIQQGNALVGTDSVVFAIAGTGVQTMSPASAFPNISEALLIDGWTQGGVSYSGPPLIELDGTGAGAGITGLTITGDDSLIRGLIINRFGAGGVLVNAGDRNTISGCYVGTDATGTIDLGNTGIGVRLIQAGSNLIGGATASERNLISGNAFEGIQLVGGATSNNRINGNLIGTDITGTVDLGNTHHGVELTTGPTGNIVGGALPGEGNLISGNEDSGVSILAATGNTVLGNLIGTDITGNLDLGNTDYGVILGAAQTANTIGGTAPGEGNRIAFNLHGVYVSGSQSTGNSIRGNSIFLNDGAGIELGAFGPTPNDPGDVDTGSNQLQNFPVITAAANGSTRIAGSLNSTPNTTFDLDFYSSAVADPSNHGEGESYIGSTVVTTDANGDAVFSVLLSENTPVGHFATATATDPSGNTSEFSAAALVLAPTAANVTVGGRVITANGAGVSHAKVILTDQFGTTRETPANAFGYYQFTDVEVGAVYILFVRHKSFQSIPQTVFVVDGRDDIYLEVY